MSASGTDFNIAHWTDTGNTFTNYIVTPQPVYFNYCPLCGRQRVEDHRYCPDCGRCLFEYEASYDWSYVANTAAQDDAWSNTLTT
jgi:uncharacterized OB-fold protein